MPRQPCMRLLVVLYLWLVFLLTSSQVVGFPWWLFELVDKVELVGEQKKTRFCWVKNASPFWRVNSWGTNLEAQQWSLGKSRVEIVSTPTRDLQRVHAVVASCCAACSQRIKTNASLFLGTFIYSLPCISYIFSIFLTRQQTWKNTTVEFLGFLGDPQSSRGSPTSAFALRRVVYKKPPAFWKTHVDHVGDGSHYLSWPYFFWWLKASIHRELRSIHDSGKAASQSSNGPGSLRANLWLGKMPWPWIWWWRKSSTKFWWSWYGDNGQTMDSLCDGWC